MKYKNIKFRYRVTKYNPTYRNELGHYLRDEWIMYSEIGDICEGKKLTYTEYKKKEDLYIQAILLFMECLELQCLTISKLETNGMHTLDALSTSRLKKHDFYTPEIIKFAESLKSGMHIEKGQIPSLVRLILRNNLWCKLESEKMYVHFGWDYYMFIGSEKPCEIAIKDIEQSGLFVEKFTSPYISRR